jgi:hypothetical protein
MKEDKLVTVMLLRIQGKKSRNIIEYFSFPATVLIILYFLHLNRTERYGHNFPPPRGLIVFSLTQKAIAITPQSRRKKSTYVSGQIRDSPPLAPLPFSTGDTFPVLTAWPLAPFCSAAVRPLGVAYLRDGVLLEIAAVVGLVELELPPPDPGVAVESMRRAPSGLSGVFTRSFVTPANKDFS